VHSEDFSEYGGVPRHALHSSPNGHIYALMGRAIVRITPGSFEHVKLSDSQVGIGAGGALHEGVLYFSSGTHLWSYQIP
jgi:hypothetical protein